ncbi:MAG TPA: hypothetical protein VM733_11290 [Thermoanaerobaculia bacterium]|nr:hypothetical protein [Thermoanaerobaculia bacterium]
MMIRIKELGISSLEACGPATIPPPTANPLVACGQVTAFCPTASAPWVRDREKIDAEALRAQMRARLAH